jgi:peroxiredoxin
MEGTAIKYPEMVFLTTPGKRERASFYLENSEITISGHLDSLSKVKVTGSKTQNEYSTFSKEIEAFRGNFESISKDMMTARQSKDTIQIAQIQKEIDVIISKVKAIQKNFIKNNPQSYATPVILQSLLSALSSAEIESIINAMDPGVARTPVALQIKERISALKLVDLGQKAPDFTLNDVKGNPVSLSSKIGTKLLLIDFWAAWCGPCRRENPNVVKVYNQFKGNGFDILGVSLDRNKEEWISAIAKDNLPWTQVSDLLFWNSPIAKLYAVNSIPANFLLDQDGKIVAKNIRGDELIIKVKELLGEK